MGGDHGGHTVGALEAKSGVKDRVCTAQKAPEEMTD